jgi:tripartite-type tricarboxylate transporter receptor subunit TctC
MLTAVASNKRLTALPDVPTAAAIADPAVRSRFTDFGAEPLASTPEELGRYISAEVVKWREIITRGGITLD